MFCAASARSSASVSRSVAAGGRMLAGPREPRWMACRHRGGHERVDARVAELLEHDLLLGAARADVAVGEGARLCDPVGHYSPTARCSRRR